MEIEQYFELSRGIENHHVLFYKIWELGKPVFTNSIDTAAVCFNEAGDCIDFQFNEDFWNSLNDVQKQFIICHECLHVVLNHGTRLKNRNEQGNIAADIVVNHMLVEKFGFKREDLGDFSKTGCWVDTVWSDGSVTKTNESVEYYLSMMSKQENEGKSSGIPGTSGKSSPGVGPMDGHENIPSLSENQVEELSKDLTEGQRDSFNEMAGSQGGSVVLQIPPEPVAKKKKWETVIKKWARKYDKPELKDVEQWARTNRRFAFMSGEFFLPTDMEIDHEVEGKTDVWFFQDTSGSCRHLAKRFLKAARSLNPKVFNVRAFCFDTRVFEIDINIGKLRGFGGTRFDILEKHIQKVMSGERCEYPKAVFVITDGYGNRVYPQLPKNWYWFMSTNYFGCIPKESNIYKLRDFE